jgi:hypothetical protein
MFTSFANLVNRIRNDDEGYWQMILLGLVRQPFIAVFGTYFCSWLLRTVDARTGWEPVVTFIHLLIFWGFWLTTTLADRYNWLMECRVPIPKRLLAEIEKDHFENCVLEILESRRRKTPPQSAPHRKHSSNVAFNGNHKSSAVRCSMFFLPILSSILRRSISSSPSTL